VNLRQATAMWLGAIVLVLPKACGPAPGGGKENTTDEIVVQFMSVGVFRWNTSISAHEGNMACRWKLVVAPKGGGKERVIRSGDYGDAKIKVEKPDRVDVFLKYNPACGVWGDN
jgi:hypothetical protein